MTNSIPKELIDTLSTRIIVAGQVNSGRTHLLKALGAELQRKHSLTGWVYLSEFYNEGKGSDSDVTHASRAEKVLYMCDAPHLTTPVTRYGVEIYSAVLRKPFHLQTPPTDEMLELFMPSHYPENATVVAIMDVERYEEYIRMDVHVYADPDMSDPPKGTYTVTLTTPSVMAVDPYKPVKASNFTEFMDALRCANMESRELLPTLRGIREAINRGKNYGLLTYLSGEPAVLVAPTILDDVLPVRDQYRASAVVELDVVGPNVGLEEVAVITVRKWRRTGLARCSFPIKGYDLELIEQYLKGYERRLNNNAYAVVPNLRIIDGE